MFSRNVWHAGDVLQNCRTTLLRPNSYVICQPSVHFRSAFHRSRQAVKKSVFEPDPLANIDVCRVPLTLKSLVRPLIFTVGVTTVSLATCSIWEYEKLRARASRILKRSSAWLSAHQKKLFAQNKSEPGPVGKWWSSLRDSEKVFYPILAINLLVFGAWRIKRIQPFMIKYFCSNPSGEAVCIPMLLSAFSHFSTIHLAANMYVLYTFMPPAIAALGKEQFVAMYLSAAVISSFASFFYKVIVNQPGLSLGASGAIMAVLSYVCVQYPDTRLSIIFLPMYTFAAGSDSRRYLKSCQDHVLENADFHETTGHTNLAREPEAIKVIMAMDLAGVICKWKFFDHAAHLGGALFGLAWHNWGSEHIWGRRDTVVQYYRTMSKSDAGR